METMMAWLARTRRMGLWAVPLLLVGCGMDATSEPPGQPGSGGAKAGSAPEASCPAQPVPRTPLRRLTRFEYRNAVRDLLGVDASAASDLPADEVTSSFDNNASVLTVSALHAEKYVLISETLAKQAVEDVTSLTACDAAVQGDEACAAAFAKAFGRRAFRRPTTPEDEQGLLTAYRAGRQGGSHAEGIEVMIRAALQSPSFLYRLETSSSGDTRARVPLSPFELATRLSFLIWASGPDDALLDAAARGELASKAQVAAHARELLGRPQARVAVTRFFNQWSGVQRLEITTKSLSAFPTFTAELKAAMAGELSAFVQDVLWSGDRSVRSLLTAPIGFVDASLAGVYGVTVPAGSAPWRVDLPAEQGRAGILTQAGFLAVQGHPDQTSPVLRGKFVRAMLLCQPPAPPPPDIDISLPPLAAGATARERLQSHLDAGASCNACHSLMDPIGLAFESFDAMGRYRDSEGGQALDLSGEITGAPDATLAGPFDGARELALKLAESQQVRACLARQWFRFASGRSEADADECSLGAMLEAFDASSGDILELIVASTQTDAFLFRSPVSP
jgi:hypothetical protein